MSTEDIALYETRLENVLRHINHVRDSCFLLASRLRKRNEEGDCALGSKLVINGNQHDQSKLEGVEFEYLHDDLKEQHPEKFFLAWEQHVTTNPHHPEYWQDIQHMPKVYIAEMVCDWKARSDEFGTDLRRWIIDKSTKRYKFTAQSRVYRDIKTFVDLLLDREFS